MKDPIEREEAIDALKNQMSDWNDLYNIPVRRSIVILEQLPSAQPKVIYCKDCKFWKKYGYINGKPEFLPKCGFNQIYTSKDDFCSRAERKGNERLN